MFRIRELPQELKASIGFFISSLIMSGISYITTPLYTRLLTSEEFGNVALYMTWQQVFGIVAMFCLSYGVFNNGMLDYENDRDSFSFSLLILSNIITTVFAVLLFSFYPIIKSLIGLKLPFLVLMCMGFLVQPAYSFWASRQRFELKYKGMIFWSFICAFVSSSVAILCIVLNKDGNGLYNRIFGAEISLIAIYVGFYIYLGKNNSWRINTQYWKYAFVFNLPLIPHYLSTYLLNSCDKIMITNLVGASSTAYYTVAYSVASIATVVWSAINAVLIPYTYKKCKEEKYQDINTVTLPILFLFGLCCIFVILFAPEIVKIMAPGEYIESIYVIPPIVGGVFFQIQYYIYSNVVYYYKKPVFVMFGSVFSVLLNIALNYVFIKQYGYVAAAYTTILCYALQAIIDYFAMRHVAKHKIYNMTVIIILSIMIIVISLVSNIVYSYDIIRYAIVLLLILMLFVFRNKFINIFKKMKN